MGISNGDRLLAGDGIPEQLVQEIGLTFKIFQGKYDGRRFLALDDVDKFWNSCFDLKRDIHWDYLHALNLSNVQLEGKRTPPPS